MRFFALATLALSAAAIHLYSIDNEQMAVELDEALVSELTDQVEDFDWCNPSLSKNIVKMLDTNHDGKVQAKEIEAALVKHNATKEVYAGLEKLIKMAFPKAYAREWLSATQAEALIAGIQHAMKCPNM